ncbi:MAG: PilZ domain-containing protein [Methylocystis sp.]
MSSASERRAAPRRRLYLEGEIVPPESGGETSCVIRDMSATGARLRLTGSAPTVFDLRIPRDGTVHHARRVWKNGDEFGVAFVGEDVKAPATPLPIMVLRRSLRFREVDD